MYYVPLLVSWYWFIGLLAIQLSPIHRKLCNKEWTFFTYVYITYKGPLRDIWECTVGMIVTTTDITGKK